MQGEKLQRANRWAKRRKKNTKHHNFAKHYGGHGDGYKGEEDYIAMLNPEHHALFHKLFGLRTFRQAAELLLRLDQMERS
jgi:hypothetical protein